MLPSPSPRRCSFSRDASKSGRGGHGGIWYENIGIMLLKVDRKTSYNVTAIVFILFKPIVEPNELFMLSNHKEVRLSVAGQ